MMILNAISLLRIVKWYVAVYKIPFYIVLYTIVIYFIKSMSYMSYNRYIVNRR